MAGYTFYLIASNLPNTPFFRFSEHITKGPTVETDQPPQMPHTKCVSPDVILFLWQSCPLFLWQFITFPGSKNSKPLPQKWFSINTRGEFQEWLLSLKFPVQDRINWFSKSCRKVFSSLSVKVFSLGSHFLQNRYNYKIVLLQQNA